MNNFIKQQEAPKSAIQYPNLFRYYVGGCQHTFDSVQLLIDKGFQPVDSWPNEVDEMLRIDEISLSHQMSKHLYIKKFDNYQIMQLVVERKLMHLNDPFSFSLTKKYSDYYILATILLDKDGQLLKNLENDLPSITFYREENVRHQRKTTIILDAYYTFTDNYYSFTDIENVDNHLSKYSFVFRDYQHKLMAAATHCDSMIESIRLSNSTFYFDGKIYDPVILSEIDDKLLGNRFANLLRGRAAMTQNQLDLLSMSMI